MKKKCRHVKVGQNPRSYECAWYADVYLDGRRTYINLGGDWSEARARYARIVADQLEGRVRVEQAKRASNRATAFGALTEEWLKQAELGGVRERTLRQYRTHAARLREFFGDAPVEAITETDIHEFLDMVRDLKSPAYARSLWSSLKSVLNYAVEVGLLDSAPIPRRRVRFGKPEPTKRLTLSEVEQVLSELPEHLAELAEFIYLTGLRIGEALALTPADIHGDVVRVRATLGRDGKTGPPKTESSYRDVVCSPRAQAILAARSAGLSTSDRLWPWNYNWSAVALKAAVPADVTWHTFRHANATLRASVLQDIRTQQQQLGHSSIQRTVQYGAPTTNDRANASALDAARTGR